MRVDEGRRETVLRVAEGIADAMQRLVGGILALAPVGVFALAVQLAVFLFIIMALFFAIRVLSGRKPETK